MQIEGRPKYEVRGCIGVLMLTRLQELTKKMFVAMRYAFFKLLSTLDVYKLVKHEEKAFNASSATNRSNCKLVSQR